MVQTAPCSVSLRILRQKCRTERFQLRLHGFQLGIGLKWFFALAIAVVLCWLASALGSFVPEFSTLIAVAFKTFFLWLGSLLPFGRLGIRCFGLGLSALALQGSFALPSIHNRIVQATRIALETFPG